MTEMIDLVKARQWADLVDSVPKADFFRLDHEPAYISVDYRRRRVLVEFLDARLGVKVFPFHAAIPYNDVWFALKPRRNNALREGKTQRDRQRGVHHRREVNKKQRAQENRQRAKSGKKG